MQINRRVLDLSSSPIRRFNDQIAHIQGLKKFTLGEPDFPVPIKAKEAAIQAIQEDQSSYSHSRGLAPLREAISRYLDRHYGLHYDSESEILITSGATGALYGALTSLVNPGDGVLVPDPAYVIYASQVQLAGGRVIRLDTRSTGFKLTPDRLAASLKREPEARVLVLNHPANPTGVSYSREDLEALVQVARAYELLIVSDEVYAELTYDFDHVSLAALYPEGTLVINAASKSHAMTGWRMGFVAGPQAYIQEIFKVVQATVNAPVTPLQHAAIVAYDACDSDIQAMKAAYASRRDFLIQAFQQMKIPYIHPQGAFYLFFQIPDSYQEDDLAFALDLAQEARLGLVPGSAFGPAGRGYVRLSYAASMEDLVYLVEALKELSLAKSLYL